MGAYYYCSNEHIDNEYVGLIMNKVDCMDYGGDWLRMDSNFDNIIQGMITMFKISLTEGWLDIMWHGIDVRGYE